MYMHIYIYMYREREIHTFHGKRDSIHHHLLWRRSGCSSVREMGGAPRNPAPTNHFPAVS